jgi:hypothetical protein
MDHTPGQQQQPVAQVTISQTLHWGAAYLRKLAPRHTAKTALHWLYPCQPVRVIDSPCPSYPKLKPRGVALRRI